MRGLKSGAPMLSRVPTQNGTALLNDQEGQTMNKDIFEGKWKQVRGEAKSWWGKLTDDDLDRAAGQREELISFRNRSPKETRMNFPGVMNESKQ
jgi:hypothetical protein